MQPANEPPSSTQLGSSPLVSLDFPAALSQRVINALKADPKTVDLRAQAPHFYALGARILELFEEEEIVDVLLEVRRPAPA
jgi:GINS complex subunit 3